MDIGALLKQHRLPVLLVGGGAAAGLGLYSRSRGKAGPGAAGATTTVSAQPGSSRGPTYDSTANDLYNSIEPQIQALADQLGKLGGTVGDQGTLIGTVLGNIPPPTTNGTPAAAPAPPAPAPQTVGWAPLARYDPPAPPVQPVNPASLPAPVAVAPYSAPAGWFQPVNSPTYQPVPAGSQQTNNVFTSLQVETWDTIAAMTHRTADDLFHMNQGTGIAGNQPIPAGTQIFY